MNEHVLVVGTGRNNPALLRRDRPHVRTTLICQVEYLGNVREPAGHVRVIGVRGDSDDQEWITMVSAVHTVDPFTRIATFGERDQDRYAAIGEALGLSALSPATVAVVHDKDAMRTRLRETGVDATAHARVPDLAELTAFVRDHGLPVVVKPVHSMGSAGVTKVGAESELAAAFERASGSYMGLVNTGVLVEQFHDGPQFSVEAFTEHGVHQVVGITRKYSDPVSLVELGHVSPAPLSDEQQEEVHTYIGRMLDALGVESGPTHTEIVLTQDGPRTIETHVRAGGDEIPALTFDATGVDIAEYTVRQTLGEKILPDVRATLAKGGTGRGSAIWFAAVDAPGEVEKITGVEEARALPGVTDVSVTARPGSMVGTLVSSESRIAQVRAEGETAEEAVRAAREAVALLGVCLKVRPLAGDVV
ncbi:ATP-grasp domain-containing protein [Streptomyces luteogriseus]|uniref:ATP-grasp domain-containing protein n=1 Tax=Streptomyces TaxID=1883 RepID=UPI0004CA2A80|nr:ATP-grasp domain-containing protein [Streptomyces sp. NRRL S-475]